MKYIILFLTFCLFSSILRAQAPEKLSYQAVIRDNDNNLLQNQSIGLQIEIIQGSLASTAVYSEFQAINTNENGLISAEIGNGTTSDDFSTIDWGNGPFFIKTRIDPEGGNNFTITGVKELLSVPFALYSKHAKTVDQDAFEGWDKNESDDFSGDYDDLSNKPQNLSSFNNDVGYLTNESDPLFDASPARNIFHHHIEQWNNKLDEEEDPDFHMSVAAGITPHDTATWNAKVSSESDPIFHSSVAAAITEDDTAYWNNLVPVGVEGNLITHDGNNWVAKDLVLTTSNTGGGQYFSIMQPFLTIRFCIALAGIYPTRNSANPFIAEIQMFAFTFAPRNFANCDGQLLSIPQYTALFSLVGTTYGGDGRTTFGLPDLRGRVPMHTGQGPGLSGNYTQGTRGGAERATLSTSHLPPHSHIVNISFEDQ